MTVPILPPQTHSWLWDRTGRRVWWDPKSPKRCVFSTRFAPQLGTFWIKNQNIWNFNTIKLSVISLEFFENEKGSRNRESFQPITVTSHPASSYWEREKKCKSGRKCRRDMKNLQKQSLTSSQCYPTLSSQTHQFSSISEILSGKCKGG